MRPCWKRPFRVAVTAGTCSRAVNGSSPKVEFSKAACSDNAHAPHCVTDRAVYVSTRLSTARRTGPSRSNTCTTTFAKHEFPILGIPLMRRRSHFHAPSEHISRAGLPYHPPEIHPRRERAREM
eukprot:2258389-Pyramimonas_sp.AAC.1